MTLFLENKTEHLEEVGSAGLEESKTDSSNDDVVSFAVYEI